MSRPSLVSLLQRLEQRCWPLPLALLLLTLLLYANSFPAAFIQDDHHIVANNPLVASFDLVKIFTSEYWQGIESNGLFRPLTILSLAVNRALFGPAAWGFHLVNLLLHGAVAILLMTALRRWGAELVVALLAALLFVLHPLHSEVVNQVVGRSELLVALFLLLALVAAQGAGARAIVLTGGCYLAALLSKEHAITFIPLLLVHDYFAALTRLDWRRRLPLYGALVAVTAGWLLWRHFAVAHDFPPTVLSAIVTPLAALPPLERILSALQLQWLYLAKLALPFGLQAAYASSDLPAAVDSLFSLRGLVVAGASLAALAGLAIGCWRRSRLAGFVALYLLSFALTANLFFAIGVTFAERLSYLPSLWFCAALAWGAGELWKSGKRRLVVFVMIGVYLLLLTGLLLERNPDFTSELRYWQADVESNPDDVLALVNYVDQLANVGRVDAAETLYRRLFTLEPEFVFIYRSYTNFLLKQQRYREALVAANQALALARKAGDQTGSGYDLDDLGRIYLEMKDYAQALAYFEESARTLGHAAFSRDLRGVALAGLGRYDEALEAFSRADVIGEDVNTRYHLALTLFRQGQLKAARARLEELAASGAINAESWNLLGVICAQQGDGEAAVTAFQAALALAPQNNYYRENLQRAQSPPVGESRP